MTEFNIDYQRGFIDGFNEAKEQYERPQGEWISREDMDYLDENKVVHNHFECNKCGLIHDFIDGHTSQYKFCPNCGISMRWNTKRKGTPIEGNNESYNCEDWIP